MTGIEAKTAGRQPNYLGRFENDLLLLVKYRSRQASPTGRLEEYRGRLLAPVGRSLKCPCRLGNARFRLADGTFLLAGGGVR